MPVSVDSRGRVTFPKSVRLYLGIAPGSAVEFRLWADGHVSLERTDHDQGAGTLQRLRGHAGAGMTTDEIMRLTRGDS